MTFVLDASVTFAWAFADEASPYADDVFGQMRHENVLVPSIWWLEVINGLVMGERRQRLTLGESTRFVRTLRSLPIKADEQAGVARIDDILSFSRDLGLTAYDAAYLEVSLHHGVPLASQDARMRAAAERAGVTVFPPER